MIKNWFSFVVGVLYIGAAITEVAQGRAALATVYVGYAGAAMALAFV